MINITTGDPTEFLINVNHQVYGGWFFFIMLWILGIILYRKAQDRQDQPLVNAMYIFTALTILSFFLRLIYVIKGDIMYALMSDWQMWIFPLLAVGCATIVKFTSEN
jgi:hypothetical protein